MKTKTKFLRCTSYLNSIKKPYKSRCIANSSSCTTTDFSKLLTSCLTTVKNMLSNIVKRYMRDLVKIYFKSQVKFWINLTLEISMRPVCLLMILLLFTLLYLIIDLNERTFNREGSPYLANNDRNAFFFTSEHPKNIMHDPVKMYVMRKPFCWTTFLFHSAPSCKDK